MAQSEQAGAPGAELPKGRKLTSGEIARDWGTSPQYVRQKIKAGCPVDSLEAARKWREEHAKYGVGYRSRPAREKVAEEAAPAAPAAPSGEVRAARPAGEHDFSTLAGCLAAAVEVEEEAYGMVREAQQLSELKSSLSTRIQNYNHARAGRLEAAERVQKLREAEELVVPMDKAKEMIRRAIVPLLTRLRSVPKRAAIKVCPNDDVYAEGILAEEMEFAIAEARGAFGNAEHGTRNAEDESGPASPVEGIPLERAGGTL